MSVFFEKRSDPENPLLVPFQARVSELEDEMMQLQPDIVDVQRQPWRSGETLDTLYGSVEAPTLCDIELEQRSRVATRVSGLSAILRLPGCCGLKTRA